MSFLSLATLPTSLKASTSFFLSPSMARPAESYPRYSRRERPNERERGVLSAGGVSGGGERTRETERERGGGGEEDGGGAKLVARCVRVCVCAQGGGQGAGHGSGKLTVDESVEDELAVLLDQIVDVTKDSTARKRKVVSPCSRSIEAVSQRGRVLSRGASPPPLEGEREREQQAGRGTAAVTGMRTTCCLDVGRVRTRRSIETQTTKMWNRRKKRRRGYHGKQWIMVLGGEERV